ncbi:hypothetical protein MalM25_11860 [Planctomycetes bacterium MalM25]|nr:hypothetical protein MalM25_11860 [Planctomycetes bacterium MalM25]
MERLGKTCRWRRLIGLCLLAAAAAPAWARRPDGQLELTVTDADERPIAARLHLQDPRGRPVRPARGVTPWGAAPLADHVYLDGPAVLGLRRGAYRFRLDAGPEYRTQSGHFEIVRHAEDSKPVAMTRAANLAEEGWLAADLASCRPEGDYPLLRRAESLAYTPKVVAAWDGEAWTPPPLAERRKRDKPPLGATALWDDPRGVVWLIDPDRTRAVDALSDPNEGTVSFLRTAREKGWRTVASITSRELPLWVAHEVIDAVVVLDNWSSDHPERPRDKRLYPGEQGPGRWRRALYESLIESGVRLPAVALTGSGLNTTPIGASRVYALTEGDDSSEAWWQAAEELVLVVTNGPLLRPYAAGLPPGQTFFLDANGKRTLSVGLNLSTRSRIEYLEIIKNGEVAHSVRLAEYAAAGGKLPEVTFDAPGWLAIAAVAEASDRYELALSAPWFVEDAKGGRVSQKAIDAWAVALAEAREEFGEGHTVEYDAAESWWRSRAER